jgi:hypothetical protein
VGQEYMEKLTSALSGKHICKWKEKMQMNWLTGFGPMAVCEDTVINFRRSVTENHFTRRTAIK